MSGMDLEGSYHNGLPMTLEISRSYAFHTSRAATIMEVNYKVII